MIDEALWRELEAAEASSPGLVTRRVRVDSHQNIFIAVRIPDAKRMLLLRVASASPSADLAATRTLSVTSETVGEGCTEIRIMLESAEMNAVFTPFVIDVVDAIAAANSDGEAILVLAERYAHWRTMLDGSPDGLADIALRGLFGEIWTIRHVVAPAVGVDDAVRSWTGPNRERRDFLLGGIGVEVKTTTSAPPAAVMIQSELQLDNAPLDVLVLVALELDRASSVDGQSVVDLVAWVRANSIDAAMVFDASLLAYGYHDVHAGRYESRRYVVRQLHLYEVGDGFPRITPRGLHPGVGEVSYRLSLGACEPWSVAESRVAQLLVGGHRGALS